MKSIEVKGTARTIAEHSSEQSRALKALRKNNCVPCVLYGAGDNVHFTVTNDEVRNLIYTPHIYVVDLDIDGKKVKAILKDVQFHPVKDTILHIDFFQIDELKPIIMEVPVQLEGLAEGVKAGGKLVIKLRKVKVRGLISKIPANVELDITPLVIGKGIAAGDINIDGLTLLHPKNISIVSVQTTRNVVAVEEAPAAGAKTAAPAAAAKAAPAKK